MIAKYPAKCRYCGKPIEVGRDEYDVENKNSYHIECFENQAPSAEDFAKAERLGFVEHTDAAIRVAAPGWVHGDWAVRRVPTAGNGDPAGRPGAAAHRRQDATLFEA